MGIMRPQNNQIKFIVLAVGGSIAAAAGTMFVPTSLLEGVTGATGLSELVPATAAPLGDTARALIAFAAGVVMLILLLAFLLRQRSDTARSDEDTPGAADAAQVIDNIAERLTEFKERFASIKLPKMPWTRGEEDILDLADLPKLRDHDAHPDAPARRPISALTDLAGADLTGSVDEPVAPDAVTNTPPLEAQPWMAETVIAEPAKEAAVPQERHAEPVPTVAPAAEMPALETMVAELEAAVEQRKLQLAKLENAAEKMMADKAQAETDDKEAAVASEATLPETEQPETSAAKAPPASPPPLEAVPVEPRAEDDEEMDAALNAALETLQRMNGAQR